MSETILDSGERREYKRHAAGDKHGKLTLVERMPGGQKWRCVCECGEEVITQISRGSRSCAKCAYKAAGDKTAIHKESPSSLKNASRLYKIWTGMRNRCNNPKNSGYASYGGRGITVCPEWDSYLTFKEWATSSGYSDELTLDRVDNNGNYEPANCAWHTRNEQMRNTRMNHFITIEGVERCVMDWCNQLNIVKSNAYCKSKKIGIPVDGYLKFKYYNRSLVCTKERYNRWAKGKAI